MGERTEANRRTVPWITALVLGALILSGCKVTSIDAEYKARIDACERIVDEGLRVQCLNALPDPNDETRK